MRKSFPFVSALALALCICTTGSGCGGGTSDDGGGGGTDAVPGTDATPGTDSGGGSTDSGGAGTDSGGVGTDSGGVGTDSGALCGPMDVGTCTDGALSCLCCPFAGPLSNCLCTTACTSNGDCTDAARPMCNQENPGSTGICTDGAFVCNWGAICASPDTSIATPGGDRPIASLVAGDLVYSMHAGRIAAVPILRASRTAVRSHGVVRVLLANGSVLEISPGHPTADGQSFGDLRPDDRLDGLDIVEVAMIPYEHAYTYDILPASDTGTYVAGGALIGSTLAASR